MSEIILVDKENTELSQLDIDYDAVMSGEPAELDAEKKLNRKTKYITMGDYITVTSAYAKDLADAYTSNESLEAYITQLEAENDEMCEYLTKASETLQKSQNQLQAILDSDEGLRLTEELLSTLEGQIDRFEKSKTLDDETIAGLRAQVADLEASQTSVEELTQEVNEVLGNLQGYFAEEGVYLGDDEE